MFAVIDRQSPAITAFVVTYYRWVGRTLQGASIVLQCCWRPRRQHVPATVVHTAGADDQHTL